MADSGKQSPLGINAVGSLIQNIGFYINPVAEGYLGTCKYTDNTDSPLPSADNDYKPGTLVNDTCLQSLTLAINDGFRRGAASQVNPITPGATGASGPILTSSYFFQPVVLASTTDLYILSVYIKAGTGNAFFMYIENDKLNGAAYFDGSGGSQIVTGTVTSPSNLIVTSAGSGYYRVSGAFKNLIGPKNVVFGMSTAKGAVTVTSGKTGSFWRAQLEVSISPTTYTPTPYVVGGVNLLSYPSTFSNSAWIRNYCYVATDPVTAPDGTKTAYTFTTGYTLSAQTYNNLVNIGKNTMPVLGNSPPATWKTDDPSGVWVNQHTDVYTTDQAGAPANSGYPFYNWDNPPYQNAPPTVQQRRELAYKNEGQLASWYPWLATNNNKIVVNRNITQWGWLRCFALQAWNEFNFNGEKATGPLDYANFCFSFTAAESNMNYTNSAIYAIQDSQTFLKGTYSNQNDLISADILGVCLANRDFGQDLINLGNAIDYSLIKTFGLPSTTLQTLYRNNALTTSLVAALLTAGISQNDIINIANGTMTATKDQEQSIYSAMLIITGPDLAEILVTLNCSTKTIEVLADLVNVKKMFPTCYQALTVPLYNTQPGPTNSKTYYPIYSSGGTNPALQTPAVKTIVGTITPPSEPSTPPAAPTVDISSISLGNNVSAVSSVTNNVVSGVTNSVIGSVTSGVVSGVTSSVLSGVVSGVTTKENNNSVISDSIASLENGRVDSLLGSSVTGFQG